ncbi:MAG: hypothetical protein ACJAQ3_002851 [Planctomycetota bacterium]
MEAQEGMNPASEAQAPYTVDDTGRGAWVFLTAALLIGGCQLVEWMIWDAVQKAQEVQPW